MIEIYTDGACRGNQKSYNFGGWGYIIKDTKSGKTRQCWGHQKNTTNNRMEMLAAIKALRAISKRPASEVIIYSDCNLLIKGMTEWLSGWKAKGWKSATKKPVENKDLWLLLDEYSSKHSVTWNHIKGHSGHPQNELADQLANRGADGEQGHHDYQN